MKKKLLWIFGSIGSICALAWLAIAVFFPAEKIRLMLEERASVELGVPVEIGSVSVSIWGGLGALVADISVGDTTEAVVSSLRANINAVDVKVRFWPLLQGEYVVDRLLIERPELHVSVGGSSANTGSSIESGSGPDVAGAKLALGGLSFGKLEINDGFLERFDEVSGSSVLIEGLDFTGNLIELDEGKLFESQGKLDFERVVFREAGNSSPIEINSLGVNYQLRFDSALNRIELTEVEASFGAGKLSLQGEVLSGVATGPIAKLHMLGNAPFSDLASLASDLSSNEFSGEVKIDLNLMAPLGQFEKTELEGTLEVTDGAMDSPDIPAGSEKLEALNASFQIFPDRIEIKALDMVFSESNLAVTGIITNPFPYLLPVSQQIRDNSVGPYLQFSVLSKRLNIDRLFPEAAPGSGGSRSAEPSNSTLPFFLPAMKGSGTVKIDTLIYSAIEFVDVETEVIIERHRIFCNNAKGEALGGDFEGEVLVDLASPERPEYSGNYAAHDLDVSEFANRFIPWEGSGVLAGAMSVNGSYRASGLRKEDFIAGLSMDILTNADSLRLTSSEVSDALIASIQRVSGNDLAGDKYQTLDFRSFKSQLRFVDGKLLVDTVRGISSSLGRWKLHGTVDMEGEMSLSGLLVPTKEIIRAMTPRNSLAGALAAFLQNAPEGSITIPFTIAGKWPKPEFALDTDALSKALNRALKNEGGNILKGLFKRR